MGLLGLVAFVLTGQYMAMFLDGLNAMADGPRLLYRTSHLYLMWASLTNLVIGVHMSTPSERGARAIQGAASALLLVGPPLMMIGFFVESPANDLDRMFCRLGNYFALAGTLLYVGASLRSTRHET